MNPDTITSINQLSTKKNEPWICPRCRKVNAPHMDQCKCTSSSQVGEFPA